MGIGIGGGTPAGKVVVTGESTETTPVHRTDTTPAPATTETTKPFEAKGEEKTKGLDFGYADPSVGAHKGGGVEWGTTPAFDPNIGTGTHSVGVDPKFQHPKAAAIAASPELAKANAAELPGLHAKHSSPDASARAFAKMAVDGMMAALIADQPGLPKSKQRSPERLLLDVVGGLA